MKTVKLRDDLFESLIDLVSHDFDEQYKKNLDCEPDEADSSFMRQDYEIMEALIIASNSSEFLQEVGLKPMMSRWKDRIKEVEDR